MVNEYVIAPRPSADVDQLELMITKASIVVYIIHTSSHHQDPIHFSNHWTPQLTSHGATATRCGSRFLLHLHEPSVVGARERPGRVHGGNSTGCEAINH